MWSVLLEDNAPRNSDSNAVLVRIGSFNPELNIVRSEIMVLGERLQMKEVQEGSGEYLSKLTLR